MHLSFRFLFRADRVWGLAERLDGRTVWCEPPHRAHDVVHTVPHIQHHRHSDIASRSAGGAHETLYAKAPATCDRVVLTTKGADTTLSDYQSLVCTTFYCTHQNLGSCLANTAFSIGIPRKIEHPRAYRTISMHASTDSTSGCCPGLPPNEKRRDVSLEDGLSLLCCTCGGTTGPPSPPEAFFCRLTRHVIRELK